MIGREERRRKERADDDGERKMKLESNEVIERENREGARDWRR